MSSATSSGSSAEVAAPSTGPARVVVLADDLIWAERLAGVVRAAGAEPVRGRPGVALEPPGAGNVIVDLSARRFDPLEAIRSASAAGARVLAVAPHDAAELRRSARRAGAGRVVAYRTLHERGRVVLAGWLESAS